MSATELHILPLLPRSRPLQPLDPLINLLEAPTPIKRKIAKRPQIKAIVIGRVILHVQTRRHNRHLVAIDCPIVVKPLNLIRDLFGREVVFPLENKRLPHAKRAEFALLAQAPEDAEFVVCHAHVGLVGLRVFGGDGLEFGGGRGFDKGSQDGQRERSARPGEEGFQIGFGDAANGIDVCARAVVFREIAAQTLIHVAGAQDQQAAAAGPLAHGGKELGVQVGGDHARAGLDVLQRKVLGGRAAGAAEVGGEGGGGGEGVAEGVEHGVYVHIGMFAADGGGEVGGARAGFDAGLLFHAHEDGFAGKLVN
jgi:hypothetical protein